MHPLVTQAVETISRSRDEGGWKSLNEDVLSALVLEFGEDDLANRLYREIPHTVPYEIVCDLFDLLAWRTNDNGASVTRSIEDWPREGQDDRKLRIALYLEVYPFIDMNQMEAVELELPSFPKAFGKTCGVKRERHCRRPAFCRFKSMF